MTTHPTAAAILRDVLEHPDDDVPRLVLADWLEEHGEGGRAEFVRTQLQLDPMRDESLQELKRKGQHAGRPCRHTWPEMCANCRALCKREKEIIGEGYIWEHPNQLDRWLPGYDTVWPMQNPPVWRRGFVESIALPFAAFTEHAEALFAAHPITTVHLSDVAPYREWFGRPAIVWQCTQFHGVLPPFERTARTQRLYSRILKAIRHPESGFPWNYSSLEEARIVLSVPLVAWARDLVGLPQLPETYHAHK